MINITSRWAVPPVWYPDSLRRAGWVGPRACLNVFFWGGKDMRCRDSNSNRQTRNLVPIERTEFVDDGEEEEED